MVQHPPVRPRRNLAPALLDRRQPANNHKILQLRRPREELVFRGLTECAGRSKIGKSRLALDVAIGVATGRDVLGSLRVKASGGVLLCDLENARGTTKKRLEH